MQIHGLNKTTLLDYPEHVAATFFCGGCNFRCPFCHNGELVLNPGKQPLLEEQEVLAFLKKRKGILTGVCITGGEPTLQADLPEFIYRLKDMGYLVKLDTNGYRPEILKKLTEGNLLDYIAMDIKAGPSNYVRAVGMEELDLGKICESIDFILHCGVQYEFRTTVVNGLHTMEDFAQIGPWIKGCRNYFLQNFRDNKNVIQSGFGAFTKEELEKFADRVKPFVDKVVLRGIE